MSDEPEAPGAADWISVDEIQRSLEDEYRGWTREEVQRLYFGRCHDPKAGPTPGSEVREPPPGG